MSNKHLVLSLALAVLLATTPTPMSAQQRTEWNWGPAAPTPTVPVQQANGPSGSDIGAGIGFLLGVAGGYYAIAADDASTSDIIVYGTGLAACLGLVASFIGYHIGAMFDG